MNATTYEHAWTRAQAERTRVARYFIARRAGAEADRVREWPAAERWYSEVNVLWHAMTDTERGLVIERVQTRHASWTLNLGGNRR